MQKLSSKEIIAIWFAIIAACISITALWMPPQGIIDETVLILIGQLLLFIATLVGVDGALARIPSLTPPVKGRTPSGKEAKGQTTRTGLSPSQGERGEGIEPVPPD